MLGHLKMHGAFFFSYHNVARGNDFESSPFVGQLCWQRFSFGLNSGHLPLSPLLDGASTLAIKT